MSPRGPHHPHRFILPKNHVRLPSPLLRLLSLCLICLLPAAAQAAPIKFAIPAQPADAALLAFSKQAGVEILFSYDELHQVQSDAVEGWFETEAALSHLLEHTGFLARRNGKGKYVVTLATRPTGSIKGSLLQPGGAPAAGLKVLIAETNQSAVTDENGGFDFASVPPGKYQLTVHGANVRPLTLTDVKVSANHLTNLKAQTMQIAGEVIQLEPYIVKARSNRAWPGGHDHGVLPLRVAAGNLDLPRSVDDALAFQIYSREQITRSGVVNLNEFLQRELLDSNGATAAPDSSNGSAGVFTGSTNLNLRGFDSEETVILVNGRRLPEVLTNLQFASPVQNQLPDVNFIPLSMVQQVEVLPVSASSLYTGNPVGGVINIVLRPEVDATEVTTTYSNATSGFDAPQSSLTLQHGQSLLNNTLRFRLSANFTRIMPATESELGYLQANSHVTNATPGPVFRATPNIRSADGSPLFGPGTATTTSVAPGANGTAGLSAFAQRQGVLSLDFFSVPAGLVTSPYSTGFAYGQRQQRSTYFGSVVYDVTPWLQLGVDGTFSRTVVNRGLNLFAADLSLPAGSPFNPFGKDVMVSLNESVPQLGDHFNEARLESSSLVFGALFKLPSDWRVALDVQYAHTLGRYRGLTELRPDRWQELVDQGLYNPLRDTQVFGPPKEFYNRVLVHFGEPGRFVTLGNYQALDTAVRVTNQSWQIPTGLAAVNFGADYRRNHLSGFIDERRFGDGSPAITPDEWTGRSLQHWSVFGELQAPLLPQRWLPAWLRSIETDLAVRYVGARSAKESYVAPTAGLKIEFAGGFSFRSSVSTSSRFPTPHLSKQSGLPGGVGGINTIEIRDPRRNDEKYPVLESELLGFELNPESALTQTAGLIFQHGKTHRIRAALDFFDTSKTDELVTLDAQTVLALEAGFPERVVRAAPQSGEIVGKITSLNTGRVNLASRHSQNWNGSLDYTWTKCLGGTLHLNGRLVYFQRFDRTILPGNPVVDELENPDGTAKSLLKYRANLGAGWSNQDVGFGLEFHYYHSRILPILERPIQGSDRIGRHYQFDTYLQGDLTRWLPSHTNRDTGRNRYGLHAQLRVNNLFAARFPHYAYDTTAGVQPYGDWRGRTYTLSLTATF